jgi:hypothetical protein
LLPLKQTLKAIQEGLAAEEVAAHQPSSADNPFTYQWSLVSYFDVLGMREILKQDDPNDVARVLNIARLFSAPDEEVAELYGWKFVNFSDLILRAVAIRTETNAMVKIGLVFHELLDLANIQVNLIAKGVLVRGALTIGPIAIKDGLVFGPALANAYTLESKTAIFPRIVVEDLVLEALEVIPLLRAHDFDYEINEVKTLIQQDFDGMWFVDYLGYMFDNADDHTQHVELINSHKSTVHNQLTQAALLPAGSPERQSRVAKALWLKEYHNRHVGQMNETVLKTETGADRATLFA